MIKRQLITFFLLIGLTGSITAENFYESYPESERLMIADAYLAVSEHYRALGESDKAASFRDIALEVYPEIETDGKTGELPETTEQTGETRQMPATAPIRPSGTEPATVRYYFSKLMRGIFSEDLSPVMSLISTRLYLPGFEQGVSREEVERNIKWAFKYFPLDSIDPHTIYNFKRYFVKKEGTAWTVKVNLTPEGVRIMNETLSFPGESHIFYFREYREGWRLIAISSE